MVGTLSLQCFPQSAWLDAAVEVPFTYAKWDISDWIKGTEGMSLEIEGAYKRFCIQLYRWGRPLADDDKRMAALMAISLRVWKRVKAALVEAGKIIVRNGSLTNSRFEKERAERAATIRAQAEGAIAMHERRRRIAQVAPKLAATLDETSAKHSANLGRKHNEINGHSVLDHDHLKKEDKKIEDSSPDGDSSIAAQIDQKAEVANAGAKPDPRDRGFDKFWELYPRKIAKGAAQKIWRKLSLQAKYDAYDALKKQADHLREKARDLRGNFCPHPATWLNQGRWMDDVETEKLVRPTGADKPRGQRTESDDFEAFKAASERRQAALAHV